MLEEQHPIPQQISSYQFRLVGDMTIKQFFQVAAGALVSLFFYSSSLPVYFKWPLVIGSFLFGIALAFFPIQDRPLITWILLFFKAIYSPTIYLWKKDAIKSDFFLPEDTVNINAITPNAIPAPTVPDLSTLPKTPNEPAIGAPIEVSQKSVSNVVPDYSNLASLSNAAVSSNNQVPEVISPVKTEKRDVSVPKKENIKVDIQEKQLSENIIKDINTVEEKVSPISGASYQGVKATFIPEASPPQPPTTPNVIVGQILTSEGKIIDNAILDILDSQGRPVRALKSNKLGHFMIVTPLTNGKYTIITEKDGYLFDAIEIEAAGKIIPPIGIVAKLTQN